MAVRGCKVSCSFAVLLLRFKGWELFKPSWVSTGENPKRCCSRALIYCRHSSYSCIATQTKGSNSLAGRLGLDGVTTSSTMG